MDSAPSKLGCKHSKEIVINFKNSDCQTPLRAQFVLLKSTEMSCLFYK